MKTLAVGSDRSEILNRIAQLTPADQARWGRMSVQQMVCHLTDSFAVPLGERTVSPATSLFQRAVIKWAALWLPAKWPQNVATRPEVEQGKGGTPPRDFAADRDLLRQILTRFCSDPLLAPHPVFGRMGKRDWLRWGYLHTDHHLRQFGR